MTEQGRTRKRDAVLALMRAHGAESLLLTGMAAFGWYLGGARVHIALSAGSILSVRVSADGDEVYLTSNEAGRMLLEELPRDVVVRSREWHEPLQVEADLDEADVERELRDLRRTLSPLELERFRALGADAAAALTDALSSATPSMTGFELAAALSSGLVARGADPLVALVGGESRASVRHPLPTADPLGRRAMLVVCARRHGLIANATRWVRFGAASAEESDADVRRSRSRPIRSPRPGQAPNCAIFSRASRRRTPRTASRRTSGSGTTRVARRATTRAIRSPLPRRRRR